MKKLRKILAALMTAALISCLFSSSVYSDNSLRQASVYNSLIRFTAANNGDVHEDFFFTLRIPSAGNVKFRLGQSSITSASNYTFYNSAGNVIISGALPKLFSMMRSFKSKNTYYLKISLAPGEYFKQMYYTFTASDGISITDSIKLNKGDKYDLSSYTEGFRGTVRWISSDEKKIRVSGNTATVLSEGKAVLNAYSTLGDTAKITVTSTVKEEMPQSIELLGANMIYVGESFKYSYRFNDGKEHSGHEIVWSVDKNGSVNKNGVLRANTKGTAILTVTDRTAGIRSSMKVHFINGPDDVDFIPMVNGIQIANKTYPLPKNYDPGMNPEALAAYEQMAKDAAKQGLTFTIISSYRSYTKQQSTYQYWCDQYGKKEADRCSARPGYSEHQLGLAIDVNSCRYDFAYTKEAKWLAANCYKYGFIIRYPTVESEKITGYLYEPWHIRYLGKDLAYDVYMSGLTLEEYLGIDSYYRN